jgi:hypothetical protein
MSTHSRIATLDRQLEYERLDRHVRTANSLRELAFWDGARASAAITEQHDNALRKAIEERRRVLEGVKS